MIPLGPGIVQGSIELADLLDKYELTEASLLHSFPDIGGIKTLRIVECAHSLNWLKTESNGRIKSSEDLNSILAQKDYSEIVRQVVLDYAKKIRPSWLQNTLSGRLKVVHFAGAGVAQLLWEADLIDSTNQRTVEFWDTLAHIARGLQNAKLTDIGRIGERFTFEYEHQRTGCQPKWVSLDSNEDGYDILSRSSANDSSLLTIEVKTTSTGFRGSLYLTQNEWEVATNSRNHLFYIWDISQATPQLAQVSVDQLALNVPENRGKGSWQSVQIELDQYKHLARSVSVDSH